VNQPNQMGLQRFLNRWKSSPESLKRSKEFIGIQRYNFSQTDMEF
jgi:hypothetical protein